MSLFPVHVVPSISLTCRARVNAPMPSSELSPRGRDRQRLAPLFVIEWPPVYTKDGKRIKHFDAVLGSPRWLVNSCIGERRLPGLLGGDVLSQGPHQS